MKKFLFSLIAFLICLTPMTFAQHNGGMRSTGQYHGGTHMSRQEPAEHRQAVQANRGEYRGRVEARSYWDGRRFDRVYWGQHFGPNHGFYWNHCAWYGPRFVVGSRFWYGGAWFMIVDPIPDWWGDEVVYVDDIDGVYYLVNPLYPGVHIVVNVVF